MAIEELAGALTRLLRGECEFVISEVQAASIYVQFYADADVLHGEAVGVANLPKLTAHSYGTALPERLTRLGWHPPTDRRTDGGNWTATWPGPDWDATRVSERAIRTLVDAYGLEPSAIRTTSGPR